MSTSELLPELSIVIPCYNEEDNVAAICAAVTKEAEAHAASHEIIIIDNASTDRTRDIVRGICANDPRIRAIFNNRNYGQMRSPTHGIYQAAGKAVIAMCADFQDPPALIGPMVEQWRSGAQIIFGQRRSEQTSRRLSFVRRTGYHFLKHYADYEVIPNVTGFGLFDRRVVDALATWNEPEPFFRGMAVESGYRIALIPFDRPERAAGETKNDFWALFDFAVSGVASSSRRMLRLPIPLSICAGLLALAAGTGAIASWVWTGPTLFFVGIALQLSILAVLLLFLGLMGEQIRIISERTRNVPIVIEDERINFPADRPSSPAPPPSWHCGKG